MIYCKVCGRNQFLVFPNENYTTLTCTTCFKEITLLGSVEVDEDEL